MRDINSDAAKYGVVNQRVAYPYLRTASTPGARSPINPRNTSSCEIGYVRSPQTPAPADIARATSARASTILRSMEYQPAYRSATAACSPEDVAAVGGRRESPSFRRGGSWLRG